MYAKQIILLFLFSHIAGEAQDYAKYVDPKIGTDAHGHTFPGSCMPFGMVQLSPDTRLDTWDGCSGYHYSDDIIYGFSHTHLSGTGCSDYGDILIMPSTGVANFSNDKNTGYPSRVNKETEVAKCGYYSCTLTNKNINVRLSSTLRTGIHEYTFNSSEEPWVIIDLKHRDKVTRASFSKINGDAVTGYRISQAWAKEQHIYFSLRTSKTILRHEYSSDSLQLILFFAPTPNKLIIQCAISAVDEEGAKKNLHAEWLNSNIEKAIKDNTAAWNKMLSRFDVETKDEVKKKIFYTSLYHCLVAPNLYQDVDHRYRGMDLAIHEGMANTPRYTVFSLWDTYRAAHPLYQLVYPEYNKYFVMSFLGMYKESGRLPVWELGANETFCMIGNHSIPVIADALLQAPQMYSVQEKNELIEAIEGTLFRNNFCAQEDFRRGFIGSNQAGESVSKTIENSLDYAAYEKLIERFGNQEQKDSLIYYSGYYKNLFNEKTGFFQAKRDHVFLTPFEPREVNHHYTEANAYQYQFGAHHDIAGMMECFSRSYEDVVYNRNAYLDRRIKLELRLDSLFYTSPYMTGRVQPDITGVIGQYAHGNEPSHHYAYLYNYSGKTYKAQKILYKIMTELYTDKPSGLCGNEDCGQMSAWYVWSSMGMYPVIPYGGTVDIGIPLFQSIKINVPGKNQILITTDRKEGNLFVNEISVNNNLNKIRFQLKYGDKIFYKMSNKPGMKIFEDDIHKYLQEENDFMPLPYIADGESIFGEATSITLKCPYPKSEIHYSFESKPTKYLTYEEPISIDKECIITFRACRTLDDDKKDCTPWLKSSFKQRPQGILLTNLTEYAAQYSGGGATALIDGQNGSEDYHDGYWQGTQGNDIEILLSLDDKWTGSLDMIRLTALQDSRSWIVLPSQVEFFTSPDGENYTSAHIASHDIDVMDEKKKIQTFDYPIDHEMRYFKIMIKNSGKLPDSHIGAGGNSWIFIDEIKCITK